MKITPMNKEQCRQLLITTIAEAKGYHYDNGLVDKDNQQVVAVTEHEVAKILLGQMTAESDLATVDSILAVISKLPDYDSLVEDVRSQLETAGFSVPKTAQIESYQTGTPGWFRRMMDSVF